MMLSWTLLSALLLLPSQSVNVPQPDPGQADVLLEAPPQAPPKGSPHGPSNVPPRGLRKRMLGRLVQRDGSAWVGAEVRLISWPDWNYPGMGAIDDLRAQTDERGRFTVKGLLHRRYYVWAWRAFGEHAYRVSEPGRFLAPGQPFILKEQSRLVQKQMITVDCDRWSRFGPFRIALRHDPFFGTYSASVSKELDLLPWIPTSLPVGEEVELPVLPWHRVRIEVMGKGGLLLYKRTISLDGGGSEVVKTRVAPSKGKQKDVRFYLDSALTRRASGYKLYQRYMGRLVELPDVDKDGQGRVLLPYETRKIYDNFWNERGPWLVGRVEGRAEGADYNLDRMTRVGAGRAMQIRGAMGVLESAHPLRIIVKSSAGKPLPNLPLWIWQRERLPRLRRMVHVLPGARVKTDGQGRLNYPWLSGEEFALFAFLPDEMLDVLAGDERFPIHPMVLLHRGLGVDLPKKESLVLNIGDLQRVAFQIAWNKEIVRESPVVNLFSPIADNYGFMRLLRLPCDRKGRARALMPTGHQLHFLAHSVLGVTRGMVTSRGEGEGRTTLEVRARIPDAIEISGRIHDAQGRPVYPAGLSLSNPWSRMRFRDPLLRFDISRISVLADEQGRFRIFQEKIQAPLQLYVQAYRGEQSLSRSVHPLDPDAKLTGLEIEVAGFAAVPAGKQRVPLPKVRRIPMKRK